MTAAVNQSHGTQVVDWADIEEYVNQGVTLAAAEVNSAALVEGVYDLIADVVCYIKIGPAAAGVTTVNGYRLAANVRERFLIRQGSRVNTIAGGAGDLRIHKVG